jgi:signal transduction histidine kinase
VLHFRSIATRIIGQHMIAVGVTSVFLPLALYWMLGAAATDLQQQALLEHADSIAQHISLKGDGTPTVDLPQRMRENYTDVFGRHAYAIIDDSGRTISSSLADQAAIRPADAHAPTAVFFEEPRGKVSIYGVSVPKEIGGRRVWIQVSENLAHRDVLIDDIVGDFFYRVGWVTLPILLLLLAIDIAIFRRALNPLILASQQAQTIAPARTDVRLQVDRIPREVQPLMVAINRALDRLDHGFRMLREFTADAAHELRTPLTILRSRIDTIADPQVAAALRSDVSSMTRIVNQLLEIAELDALVTKGDEIADLRSICREVAEPIAPLALKQRKGIVLSGEEDAVWVKANAEALNRAVRNLVENAINHTPEGSAVEIVVEKSGAVSVLDEGPGIAEDERELIFQRFWRRDRRRTGGAGLGLSIVRRAVELHAGTISVTNRPAGGACFELRFPLSQ